MPARRADGSKPVVGSSRKTSSGSPISASATSSRRRWPPDSRRAERVRLPAQPDERDRAPRPAAACGSSRRRAPGTRATVSSGSASDSCSTTPMRARQSGPACWGSTPRTATSPRGAPAVALQDLDASSSCPRRSARGTRTPRRGGPRGRCRAPPRPRRRTSAARGPRSPARAEPGPAPGRRVHGGPLRRPSLPAHPARIRPGHRPSRHAQVGLGPWTLAAEPGSAAPALSGPAVSRHNVIRCKTLLSGRCCRLPMPLVMCFDVLVDEDHGGLQKTPGGHQRGPPSAGSPSAIGTSVLMWRAAGRLGPRPDRPKAQIPVASSDLGGND